VKVPEDVKVCILKSPLVVIEPPLGEATAVVFEPDDVLVSELVTVRVTALPAVTLL
jgi:hypothetical protein